MGAAPLVAFDRSPFAASLCRRCVAHFSARERHLKRHAILSSPSDRNPHVTNFCCCCVSEYANVDSTKRRRHDCAFSCVPLRGRSLLLPPVFQCIQAIGGVVSCTFDRIRSASDRSLFKAGLRCRCIVFASQRTRASPEAKRHAIMSYACTHPIAVFAASLCCRCAAERTQTSTRESDVIMTARSIAAHIATTKQERTSSSW